MRRIYLGLLSIGVLPLYALTYSTGPPPGRTGAPGESTCQQGCHNSFALNAGPGSLSITAPATYAPGDTLEVTVAVNQSSAVRRGFELTVKDASGNHVGTLEVVNTDYTQFRGTGNRYVAHTQAGTQQQSWTVRWRAPDTEVGPVTFYVASVGANGDGSNKGDYVYTASHTVEPVATSSPLTELPDVLRAFDVYPRPSSGPVHITYELTYATSVTVQVFDALGRRVGVLQQGVQGPGVYHLKWPAGELATGIYWCLLHTSAGSATRSIFIKR